jgi:type IV secretory pathway ATPase VirB11/archaellum biosynthesis ATPase
MPADLGWKVKNEECAYRIQTEQLSEEEDEVICLAASRFAEESRNREYSSEEEAHGAISIALKAVLEEKGLEADAEQLSYLEGIAISHIRGFSFLDPLLSDPAIEEIACIGINKSAYVYLRAKGWRRTNGYFTSQEHFMHVANKIARELGRRLSTQTPRINAVLPDGSRLHASIPPLSQCEMTIRKFTQKPISCGELLVFGACNAASLAFLSLAMQSDSSIAVCGNTSSGKTTFLCNLLSFIPLDERILLIEETPEIRIPHEHQVRLLPTEESSMVDLVHDSLRMRPDRVVVGEVRTAGECEAWMESVLSGQARGSYATFHARSAHEALRRLEASGISREDIGSIDYVVSCRRLARYDAKKRKMEEVRKVEGIYCVSGGNAPCCSALFESPTPSDPLRMSKMLPARLEILCSSLGMSKQEARAEFDARGALFRKLPKSKMGFFEEIGQFQRFAYGRAK